MRDSLESEIPHIKFKDVSFSYPGEKENLIFQCNFSIKKPGFWMVVGKNGSGKSTLLKLINGIIKPQNGFIDSKANIGMVFQNPDHQILMPNCRSELLININQNISDYEITKKIKIKIIIHKNCNLKINLQINLIFSSVQLSPVSLIIGFSIISFLYLLLPPNLIPEI